MSAVIDLNAADFQQLLSVDGIDKDRARSLIRYRNCHGRLQGWQDLQNVPGFEFVDVGTLQERGVISSTEAAVRRIR